MAATGPKESSGNVFSFWKIALCSFLLIYRQLSVFFYVTLCFAVAASDATVKTFRSVCGSSPLLCITSEV